MKRLIYTDLGRCESINTTWFGRIKCVSLFGTPTYITPNIDGGDLTFSGRYGINVVSNDTTDVVEIHRNNLGLAMFSAPTNYIVPKDVVIMYATITGGGGGGGSGYGYGGAGGHYHIRRIIKVMPGERLTIVIGRGGRGGYNGNGEDGGVSRVINENGTVLIEAFGGEGGAGASPSNDTHVARGGTNGGPSHSREQLNTGHSCFLYKGGDPANGAGGGGAGLFGDGGNGSSGGNGQSAADNSGAGGGGARRSNRFGGNGGSGYCILEWWL